MRKLGKRGSVLLNDETIGLVLAAIGVIIIAYVLFRYMGLGYDIQEETLKSYATSLKMAIDDVDKMGVSEYSPVRQIKEGEFYFLVYFGNKNSYMNYEYDRKIKASGGRIQAGDYNQYIVRKYTTNFVLRRTTENTLCMCSTVLSENYLKGEKENTKTETFSQTNTYSYSYETNARCTKCIDLDHPAFFSRGNPPVFDLNKYSFIFRKDKDSDSNTKFSVEVTELG